MRTWAALRFFAALVVVLLGLAAFAACGARSGGDFDDLGFGGGGGATVCGALGKACSGASGCCSALHCNANVCKPKQICAPDGKACALTTDCCGLDCLNGFCGGTQCSPPGDACASSDQCCNKDCFNGFCGGAQCKSEGLACS